ncbi:MAG: hypothetical protein B7Z12_18875, partial [Caulobacter vibrioides]
TSCFMLLFILVAGALTWMHLAIGRMERANAPQLANLPELPEMAGLSKTASFAAPAGRAANHPANS